MIANNQTYNRLLSDQSIATIILIIMSVQFVYFEGMETSMIKTVASVISIIYLFTRSRYFSKALLFCGLYFSILLTVYFLHFSGGEMTILHSLLYWGTFCMFYNFVYINQVYDIDSFLRVIVLIIYLYSGFFILQQFLFLIGIRYFPIANYLYAPYYSLFHLPSIAIEPSHTARVLTACMYALLKITEVKNGRSLSLRELLSYYRRPLILGFYTLLGIGSGTAIVGIIIIGLYFIKKQYSFMLVLLFLLLYMAPQIVDYEPIDRVVRTIEATMTNDYANVQEADFSASARIAPIMGLLNNIDWADYRTWFGHGKYVFKVNNTIDSYGVIVYFFLILLVFFCCVGDIQSFLIFFILLSADINNFAYIFSVLMILSGVKYCSKSAI